MIKTLTLLSLCLVPLGLGATDVPDSLRKRIVFDYFLEHDNGANGMDATTLEYTLRLAAEGNARAKRMAEMALGEGVAASPAENVRMYALAYSLWKRSTDLDAAVKNLRALESGSHRDAVEALVALFMVTGDDSLLKRAKAALPKLGTSGQFGDVLAKGQAYLALYTATADRSFLGPARAAAEILESNFKNAPAGYNADRSENLALARFVNLMSHVTGNQFYREMADHAMQYLIVPEVALAKPAVGVLLVEADLEKLPLHLAIVGSKKDPVAKQLFATARAAYPLLSKRLDWWDRAEGPLPNADIPFPELNKSAAFLCADGRCSLPLFTVERLKNRLAGSPPVP